MQYDAENRMTYCNSGTGALGAYTYDYAGRRIKKFSTLDTPTDTHYVYDGATVIAEYESDPNDSYNMHIRREYVYGPGIDNPIAMITFYDDELVGLYFYHTDALGSVIAMTSGNGVVAEKYRYSPFGRTTIYDGSGSEIARSAIGNPYMFTARRMDEESGLYYYRARMYKPEIGRFLQTDPLGYIDTINPYAYCANNPLNWIDPWGWFHFRKRPLEGLGIILYPLELLAPILEPLNLEPVHEEGFYDDEQGPNSEPSVGYGPNGVESNPSGAYGEPTGMVTDDGIGGDDGIVEEMKADPEWSAEKYNPFSHNCHHFADELRKRKEEYDDSMRKRLFNGVN
jgi:RHS repeat-associated protein